MKLKRTYLNTLAIDLLSIGRQCRLFHFTLY